MVLDSLPEVLKIVVTHSFLDVQCTRLICCVSKELLHVGTRLLDDHPTYQEALDYYNESYKLHFCCLCNKPYIEDGSCKPADTCDCVLDPPNYKWPSGNHRSQSENEMKRRYILGQLDDPRFSPGYKNLSTKEKAECVSRFSYRVMWQLYAAFPTLHLDALSVMTHLESAEEEALLALCILRVEALKSSPHGWSRFLMETIHADKVGLPKPVSPGWLAIPEFAALTCYWDQILPNAPYSNATGRETLICFLTTPGNHFLPKTSVSSMLESLEEDYAGTLPSLPFEDILRL